jgi:hypothetical protein
MNRLLLAGIFCASVTTSALARIGETLDECQLRYGVMVRVESKFRPDYPQYVYRKGDIEIRVRLYNAKSAQEIFSASNRELTYNERDEILRANRDSKTEIVWDHKFFPDLHSDVLIITTKEFHRIFKESGESGF